MSEIWKVVCWWWGRIKDYVINMEKKQYTEKLFLPQALSEKTDAPELGVCVIQVSTANGRFGSVPARGNTVFVR